MQGTLMTLLLYKHGKCEEEDMNETCYNSFLIKWSMASKKLKSHNESRIFTDWSSKYIFAEPANNMTCLICHRSISVMKEHKILGTMLRKNVNKGNEICQLKACLISQQNPL